MQKIRFETKAEMMDFLKTVNIDDYFYGGDYFSGKYSATKKDSIDYNENMAKTEMFKGREYSSTSFSYGRNIY